MKVFGEQARSSSWDLVAQFAGRKVLENETLDYQRVKDSLHIDSRPGPLPKELKMGDLKGIADFVNYTYVHYSGNCVLLAASVHFNIENNANILRAENTASPHVGLEAEVVDQVIFGKVLGPSYSLGTLGEVSKEVLRRYEVNGDRSCIVSSEGYRVPLVGESGHDFNAVVLLDSSNKPFVQYLDAWKTSNTIPAMESFERYFSPSASFTVRSIGENSGAGKY